MVGRNVFGANGASGHQINNIENLHLKILYYNATFGDIDIFLL